MVLGGCATERQTQTAVGTGAGAATGAVVGTMIGGPGRGTTVGAVVGAGVGAAAGYNWQLIKEKLGMATKGSNLQVSEHQDGGLKVNMPGSVSFATGSAMLDTRLHPTLDKVAATLNEYPATTVNVVGHTDSSGDAQANMDLSRRRADAVASYLSQRGVDRSRIAVEGKGQTQPVADNATEAGRAQNRRVEMLIRSAS
ncbi:MAG TPA: OmpA family protein [Burkholderiales bacterium]|nr:OmpA family protein [Burkholderiales bacterium]